MEPDDRYAVLPIGRVHSSLKDPASAPKQGSEGAPRARLEIFPDYVGGLDRIEAGQEILILTWLHQARRNVLAVHPRDDERNPLTGVFATRSSDRPNPIGLHRARVLQILEERWLEVDALEAIDGTPIVDLKPVLGPKDR